MARIPYVERDTGTAETRELYDELYHQDTTKQFDFRDVPNVMKALANSPKLARRISQLGHYFMSELSLDPRLRELAVLILMKRLKSNHKRFGHSLTSSGILSARPERSAAKSKGSQ